MSRQEELQELILEKDVLEPETLRQLYPDLSEEEFNKTMALKLLKHTRHFWENFYAFEDMVLALNEVIPDFRTIQGCLPEHIWYAVYIANQLRPGMEYAKEVQVYAKFICNEAGVYIYPPELGLENPYLSSATKLSISGPFPLTESSTEEIQAGKLLVIKEYLNAKIRS